MKNLHRTALLTAAFSAALSLNAQTDSGRPHGGRGPGGHGGPGGPGLVIVRTLDVDQNHELSEGELNNATSALRSLDRDGDGNISVAELRPARPTPPAGAPTPPADAPKRDGDDRPRPLDPLMLALDANADGSLSKEELANATRSLNALDANGDKKLTPDEFRPLPPTP
jgi:hypothetical protein